MLLLDWINRFLYALQKNIKCFLMTKLSIITGLGYVAT